LEELLRHRAACLLFVLAGFAAQTSTLPELRTAAATMTPDNLLRHIRELSSDAYEGRLPGTPGEDKSVAYVLSQIKAIGLQPGTPTGGFVQKVPLYGIRSRGTIAITASGKNIPLSPAPSRISISITSATGDGGAPEISASSALAIPHWTISPPKPFNARAAS
jgi:hypothetical protein